MGVIFASVRKLHFKQYCISGYPSFINYAYGAQGFGGGSLKPPLPLLHFLGWISPKRRRDLSWGWALRPSRADQPSKWAMLSPKADQPSKAQIAHSSLRVRPPTLSYRGGVACSGQSLRSELGLPRRDSRLAFASRPTGRPGSKLRLQSLLGHPN